MVVVFAVAGSLLVLGITPVEPSGWQDVLAQTAVHEERVGIRAPWPAQIYLVYSFCSLDAAAVEDVSVFYVLRCGCCGDV